MTALVATPIALYLFWQGGDLFAIAMTFLALVGWYEYIAMLKQKKISSLAMLGGAILLAMPVTAWFYGIAQLTPLVFAAFSLIFSMVVLDYKRFSFSDAMYNLVGVLYIGIPFAHFIGLRLLPNSLGMQYFAMAMIGTWACDTTAYFGGTRWGRHKLCPPISPAKSVEGAIFGFLGCLIATVITGHYMNVPMADRLICGTIVGVFCQLGDLVESALKRHMGVKDSGRFFPGHGGVLDRVDSLLFSIPAVYYYLIFAAGR